MTALLTIDVGNTNTVLGLFEDETMVEHWRVSTSARRTADEWWLMVSQLVSARSMKFDELRRVAIASVVPKATVALRRMFERSNVDPLVVDWQTSAGMRIDLAQPSEIGADRLANAVAAHEMFPTEPVIVVDMGTATTLDVVAADGAYKGGIILPGLDISMEALFDRTAALKRIDLVPPESVIGVSTKTAVQSGATFGCAAQVDGLCDLVMKEIGPSRVVATGGLAGSIAPLSRAIESYDPWLTLRGLRIVYERAVA